MDGTAGAGRGYLARTAVKSDSITGLLLSCDTSLMPVGNSDVERIAPELQ